MARYGAPLGLLRVPPLLPHQLLHADQRVGVDGALAAGSRRELGGGDGGRALRDGGHGVLGGGEGGGAEVPRLGALLSVAVGLLAQAAELAARLARLALLFLGLVLRVAAALRVLALLLLEEVERPPVPLLGAPSLCRPRLPRPRGGAAAVAPRRGTARPRAAAGTRPTRSGGANCWRPVPRGRDRATPRPAGRTPCARSGARDRA